MANPLIANFLANQQATTPPFLGTSISMPSSAPSMGAPVLPNVTAPQGTLQGDMNEHGRLVDTGSGVDQVQNPLLRGIAKGADILGSVFAPRIAQFIPGTTLHHQLLTNQAEQRVQQDEAQSKDAADTANTVATTAHTNAATTGLPTEQADAHTASGASVRLTNDRADALENAPDPVQTLQQAHAAAVLREVQAGRDPSQAPDVQHLSDAITSLQKQPAEQGVGKTTDIVGPDGKVHTMGYNQKTSKFDIDEGLSGFRPAVTNVNAGTAAIDRESKQFGTPYQKSLDASNSQLEKIADARAMINGNAEAQGLGVPKVLTALVGGQGTGVRITQAELTSIAHARGLSGDVEGTLSKWAGKGALTGEQQKQLTQIMDDVKARLLQKQQIASGTLDTINGASSRDEIIAADKSARQQFASLENGGTQSSGGSGLAVSLKEAMALPQFKGKSQDEVTAAIKAAGHAVAP